MKKMYKKLIAMVLVVSLIFAYGVTTFAEPAADNGMKVMLDGVYLDLGGKTPIAIQGRTMVPFRAFLVAMGANVDYNQNLNHVKATIGKTTISFDLDGTEITVDQAGMTTKKTMDVAPVVQDNTTYVTARALAECFGYKVDWDKEHNTAVFMDVNEMFQNADKDFSLFMSSSNSDMDMNQAYKSTGDFKMKLNMIDPDTGKFGIGVNGTLSGVSKGMDANLQMTLNVDMDDIIKMATEQGQEITESDKLLLEQLKNLQMQMKLNGNTGDMYMQSDVLAEMMQQDKDAWLKMNIYDVYNQMGIDLKSLMKVSSNHEVKLSEILTEIVNKVPANVNTYSQIKAIYNVAKNLVGDDAFVTTQVGDETKYTATINKLKMLGALADAGLGANEIAEVKDAIEGMELSGKIVLTKEHGVLTDTSVDLTFAQDGATVKMNVSGTDMDMKMSFGMTMDGVDLSMDMNMKSVKTNEKVDVSVPTGKIYDMNQMMEQAMNQPMPEPTGVVE